ncbi:AAA family ATPase [Salipaludibacillus daqingensis]|uniref:AAA family ATPase n=1 Tax=Salipaludibacillus daqingensis TaxID=3041001 RepID=UPI0024753F4D|nr:AAA family ATPase [Salipaludibacillus daqingensis]
MNKLKLLFADPDQTYLTSVSEYVLSSKSNERFELKLFSTKENLQHYITKEPEYDILVMDEQFEDGAEKEFGTNERCKVVLKSEIESCDHENNVFKYQPLNQLLSSVLSYYYSETASFGGHAIKSSKTKVLSVYSPAGGTGKTTFSANFARQLAMKNDSVFYLNFELLNSTSLYFQSPEDEPSLQVFYYLKAKPNVFLSKLEKLKQYDPVSRVHYLDLLPRPAEMLEVTKEEIRNLITALVQTEDYDYIVIDLDSAIQELTLAGLQASNQVIWLLNNDIHSFQKTDIMLDNAGDFFGDKNVLKDKSYFVINRFQGAFPQEFQRFNIPVRGYLPFIPEWVSMTDRDHAFHHPLYTKELLSLIEDITRNRTAGVTID